MAMRLNWALFGFCGVCLMGSLWADVVDVMVENERPQYLLYEPLKLRVTLTNNSGQDLVFQDQGDDGRHWIDFIVTNESSKALIHRDRPGSVPQLLLPPNQSRSLEINVTPLYAMRESGPYSIQTVVQVAGREFVSAPIGVTLINGHVIWQEKRTVDGSLFTYSLLRFTPTPEATFIYIRVEDEAENLVYTTQRLGEIVTFTDPQTSFDSDGNLHIMYVAGKAVYRYTRVSAKGAVEAQDTFSSVNDSQPHFFTTKDGSVLVQGGRKEDASTRRELLSEAQQLIRKAPEKPLVDVPAASVPSAAIPTQPSASATPPH
jgi:hypothetical protein